jgi:hypothetical protein
MVCNQQIAEKQQKKYPSQYQLKSIYGITSCEKSGRVERTFGLGF